MAIRAAAAGMRAALGRGDHIGLVLDRARAQQRLPVRGAGRDGEGGRNEQGIELAERAIQLGVAHIVANREGQPAEGAFDGERRGAVLDGARLVVALVAGGEAKEVHLVVARDAPAAVVEHQARAPDAVRVVAGDGCGAANDPHPIRPRRLRQEILDRARAVAFAHLHLVGLVAADDVEVLGQGDEARALLRSLRDQPAGCLEVRPDLRARDHLDGRDARPAQGWTIWLGGAGLKSRATLGSAQPPLTLNSAANIWPSGFLRICCATAAATPATGLTMATAVAADPPRLGTTRTLRSCVSAARSTLPELTTSAAGPRMRNSAMSITPASTRAFASMRSKRNPFEKTSRKSSWMRRGSCCRFMREISLPRPGSISRNSPSSTFILRSPARLA